jgi:hypothetical protein
VNPSRFCIPQQVSPDRHRARACTIALERSRYSWKREPARDDGSRALPPFVDGLPAGEDFPLSMKAKLGASKVRMKLNAQFGRMRARLVSDPGRRYGKLYPAMDGPDLAMARWKEDEEFARQRLAGVNPMRLRACREVDGAPVFEAAAETLKRAGERSTLQEMSREGRLFETRYSELTAPSVRKWIKPGVVLVPVRCLFRVDARGVLVPLAIQLGDDPATGPCPTYAPWQEGWGWLHARRLAQCADAHLHEGYHHLLETHLVNEVLHVALCRTMHPEHPFRQLVDPHHTYTLAIDNTGRGNLLCAGGPIDRTMGAGVEGVKQATRVAYAVRSTSTFRGFAPSAGPTIPSASSRSMSRHARLYPILRWRWIIEVETLPFSIAKSTTRS